MALPGKDCSTSKQPSLSKSFRSALNKRKYQDSGILTRDDFDGGPVSLDEIENGLYLGNLTAASSLETLKKYKITHILTLDTVPLPLHIVEASFLTTKHIHISDMPKEDILHHLDSCTEFIKSALEKKNDNNVLVHCYFGVSRSSAVVIAYAMKEKKLDYQRAFDYVRTKRRFIQPNSGFISQLKLYKHMGYTIVPQNAKYKIYRLRLAGEQVRKAKILPQNFNNVIKPDPAITQENPEPIVYRCRKCRRIVASRSHLLLHPIKLSTKLTHPTDQSLAGTSSIDELSEQMHRTDLSTQLSAAHRTSDDGKDVKTCQSILFVEPIAWMKNVPNSTQGRLNCPKCEQKLGSFSWINGCKCPCGQEVSPAFYFIPSKVELSKAVQNVEATV